MSKKSVWKRVLFWVLFAVVYINVGFVWEYYSGYAEFYPNSMPAKILMPIAPFYGDTGPFVGDPGEPNHALEMKYKTFEAYMEQLPLESKIFSKFIWPIIQIALWIVAAISWFVWLIVLLALFFWEVLVWLFKFLFLGGLPKALHLIK